MKIIKTSLFILAISLSISCKRKIYCCKCTYNSGQLAGQEIMGVKSKSEAEPTCSASDNSFSTQGLGTCDIVTK